MRSKLSVVLIGVLLVQANAKSHQSRTIDCGRYINQDDSTDYEEELCEPVLEYLFIDGKCHPCSELCAVQSMVTDMWCCNACSEYIKQNINKVPYPLDVSSHDTEGSATVTQNPGVTTPLASEAMNVTFPFTDISTSPPEQSQMSTKVVVIIVAVVIVILGAIALALALAWCYHRKRRSQGDANGANDVERQPIKNGDTMQNGH